MRAHVLGLSLAAALGACATALSPAALDQMVKDRTVWWKTRDHALDIAPLGPLETVRGGRGRALRTAAEPTIDAAALKVAIAYVEPLKTQSLLVWQGAPCSWSGTGPAGDRSQSPLPPR